MQAYWTLVRRELGAYFVSITGYLIIAITLLLLGLSFMDLVIKLNSDPTDAPITQVLYSTVYFWMILLITAPVITMRLFALEKFSGTYETLMTTPVSDLQVVLAKFTGAWVFYGLMWLPLLAYIWIVHQHANEPTAVDAGILASTFLGILLIGALYMSLGCLASALTRSQVVAAIVTFGAGIAMFVLSMRSLQATVLPAGWVGELFVYVSMPNHIEQFARGFVDLRHVTFYVSTTVLLLFVTLKVVESRRWK